MTQRASREWRSFTSKRRRGSSTWIAWISGLALSGALLAGAVVFPLTGCIEDDVAGASPITREGALGRVVHDPR